MNPLTTAAMLFLVFLIALSALSIGIRIVDDEFVRWCMRIAQPLAVLAVAMGIFGLLRG